MSSDPLGLTTITSLGFSFEKVPSKLSSLDFSSGVNDFNPNSDILSRILLYSSSDIDSLNLFKFLYDYILILLESF